MPVPFTVEFSANSNILGTSSGELPGENIQLEVTDLVNYYENNTLINQVEHITGWTTAVVTASGKTYTFNR